MTLRITKNVITTKRVSQLIFSPIQITYHQHLIKYKIALLLIKMGCQDKIQAIINKSKWQVHWRGVAQIKQKIHNFKKSWILRRHQASWFRTLSRIRTKIHLTMKTVSGLRIFHTRLKERRNFQKGFLINFP